MLSRIKKPNREKESSANKRKRGKYGLLAGIAITALVAVGIMTNNINSERPADAIVEPNWSALGTGMDDTNFIPSVNSLVFDSKGNLYAGGGFTTAGGVNANNIAKWDGTKWNALGSGLDGYVYALAIAPDGTLYAGGHFSTAGGEAVNNIAKWDGTNWSSVGVESDSLGAGVNGNVNALAFAADGTLYVGGEFSNTTNGAIVNSIVSWNGTVWNTLGTATNNGVTISGSSYGDVYALAIAPNGNLYAGGYFSTAGGVNANNIAKWDGTNWSAVGAGANYDVYSMAIAKNGDLYIGGAFDNVGLVPANYVARWNGTNWSALGTGADADVDSLVIAEDGAIYIGGWFEDAGGKTVNHIAKWNGTNWSALDGGTNDAVRSLAFASNGDLYAGGWFNTAGGISANHVARWNGSRIANDDKNDENSEGDKDDENGGGSPGIEVPDTGLFGGVLERIQAMPIVATLALASVIVAVTVFGVKRKNSKISNIKK